MKINFIKFIYEKNKFPLPSLKLKGIRNFSIHKTEVSSPNQ